MAPDPHSLSVENRVILAADRMQTVEKQAHNIKTPFKSNNHLLAYVLYITIVSSDILLRNTIHYEIFINYRWLFTNKINFISTQNSGKFRKPNNTQSCDESMKSDAYWRLTSLRPFLDGVTSVPTLNVTHQKPHTHFTLNTSSFLSCVVLGTFIDTWTVQWVRLAIYETRLYSP